MTKLIKEWEELSRVPANDKYKYDGKVVPIKEIFKMEK